MKIFPEVIFWCNFLFERRNRPFTAKYGAGFQMDFIEVEENIMQDKKLYKSRTDKKINGVCGGIAKYVGIDATAIRLAWGFLSCVYGIGVIAYIVAALVIPVEPEE